MIDLAPTRTFLDRFSRDLDQQDSLPMRRRADLHAGDLRDHRAARFAWAHRVVDEYRSVVVFTELLAHLAAVEAPYTAIAAVHRLIGDELRHARLCARVSGFFGPLDELEIALDDLGLPPTDDPPVWRAIEIVALELVVAEEESVRIMRVYRDATTDAACRDALSVLLADEVRHAATGRALLELLIGAFADESIAPRLAALPRALAEERRHIVATHASFANDGPGRMYGASIRANEAPRAREVVSP